MCTLWLFCWLCLSGAPTSGCWLGQASVSSTYWISGLQSESIKHKVLHILMTASCAEPKLQCAYTCYHRTLRINNTYAEQQTSASLRTSSVRRLHAASSAETRPPGGRRCTVASMATSLPCKPRRCSTGLEMRWHKGSTGYMLPAMLLSKDSSCNVKTCQQQQTLLCLARQMTMPFLYFFLLLLLVSHCVYSDCDHICDHHIVANTFSTVGVDAQ